MGGTPFATTIVGVITAFAGLVTAIALLAGALPALIKLRREVHEGRVEVGEGREETREVHKIVNQQRTDMQRRERSLIHALKAAGIDVPLDQSIDPEEETQ